LLLSAEATDEMTDAIIHRTTCDQEKPSDHAPVSVVLDIYSHSSESWNLWHDKKTRFPRSRE
jgi:hypothetical protein